MAVVSGKAGKVLLDGTSGTQVAEVTGWTFEPGSNNPAWHGSGGGGYKKRVAGVRDGSGTFEGKLDESSNMYDDLQEGTVVTLLLYRDPGHYFSVPSIISSISFEVDIDDGEPPSFSASFETSGAWSDNAI